MTTYFSTKRPAEAFAISFDFTAKLGAENIASATLVAIDQTTLIDVSLTVLDVANQTNTTKIVYGWVRAGTSGHDYLITCTIIGDGAPASTYELEGILPVLEIPVVGTGTGGPGPIVPPSIEPVSLQEIKQHLRLDSGDFSDNLTTVQSLAPKSYAIANNYTTHVGAYSDVLGLSAVVTLDSGTNGSGGTGGTVDVKIQEGDTTTGPWTDWTGGSFTQVTLVNDNAVYEKAYTGTKQFIRVVAKVLQDACVFGVQINKYSSDATEDDLLTALVTAARQYVEAVTRRALITQTWDKNLNCWPHHNYIQIPHGQLQSVTSVKYTDSDGTVNTMTATAEYLVDAVSEPGRVVLPYGESWPSFTPYTVNPITIRYVCGYGSTAASVPSAIRTAIKMTVEDMFEHRSATHDKTGGNIQENKTVMALLWPYRLWGES
jgi:uncharacterized phiE125 gp8 family phage protein